MKNVDFTVVLTHYGDPYWVMEAIASGDLLKVGIIKDIFILDNNHGDKKLLAGTSKYPKITILEYPSGGSGNAHHAHALNSFLKNSLLNTSHVIIMDSDLIVQDTSWLDDLLGILELFDSCLALDPISNYLTHPCYMVIPTEVAAKLDFMEGMKSLKVDTGRTVGLQLSKLGISTHLLKPKPGYGGRMGFTYLNEKIYHVTSISIRQQPHKRLGKSPFRIAVAESWRRSVIRSKLPISGGWPISVTFSLMRAIYCVGFTARWFFGKIPRFESQKDHLL